MRTAFIGDRKDEAHPSRGMSRSLTAVNPGISKGKPGMIFQISVDIPFQDTGPVSGILFGKSSIGFGHIDFAAGLFPEPVRFSVVIAVSVCDQDGFEIFQIQTKLFETGNDQVTVFIERLHTV